MEWAAGPFRAMVQRNFAEQRTNCVSLCNADDPLTFALIRDFLYAKDICLTNIAFPALLQAARAAHRWQLVPLFVGLLNYIKSRNLLNDLEALLQSVDLWNLPGIPKSVLLYFWERVGLFFGHFQHDDPLKASSRSPRTANSDCVEDDSDDESLDDIEDEFGDDSEDDENDDEPRMTAGAPGAARNTVTASSSGTVGHRAMESDVKSAKVPTPSAQVKSVSMSRSVAGDTTHNQGSGSSGSKKDVPVESKLCPKFPGLWSLALSHSMVDVALHNITLNWTQFDSCLLDLVLQYLEPRIEDEDMVCKLIAKLSRETETVESVLNRDDVDKECSTRAIRLLAKTLSSGRVGRKEMRYSWRVTLSEEQSFVRDIFFYPERGSLEEDPLIPVRDITELAGRMAGSKVSVGYTGQRKKSRQSKFEAMCQSSVRVTLSVGFDEDETVVLVCWSPGVMYDGGCEKVAVLLEVLDDGCRCTRSNGMEYERKGGCLGKEVSTGKIDQKGLVMVRLDDDMVDAYRQAHGFDCAVTISLLVRLVNP